MGPEISRIRVTLFKEVPLGLKHMLIVCLRSFLDDCSSLANKIQGRNYIQPNEAVASQKSSKNKLYRLRKLMRILEKNKGLCH